jgi:hypothetical protein
VRVLPDTSVWVDYLRVSAGGPAEKLDELLEEGLAVVCGPVAAELVAGAPPPRHRELWHRLSGLSWYDLDRGDWREVGAIAAELRTRGLTIPLTDVVIAVASIRAEAAVWTHDRHFQSIRAVLPELDLYDPRARRA